MTDKLPEPITEERYLETQEQILLFARLVRELPLPEFLLAIEKADAVAPIVDPTLWLRGKKNLATIKKMAQGLRAFQESLPQVCKYCKVKVVAYEGAIYCGAACSAMSEGRERLGFTADPAKCPKLILLASHFNADGTCKCFTKEAGGVGEEAKKS